MMTLNKDGNFNPWRQPPYGKDANDCNVVPPIGYILVLLNDLLITGDVPFDVYAGWLAPKRPPRNPAACEYPDLRYHSSARSDGRWTAWARPLARI